MTQQEQFGRRLKQLRREKSAREERDIEQEEVAQAVGDTQPNVARWERGRIPKSDETLNALAKYYGVNMFWLRYGQGQKIPDAPAPAVALGPQHGIKMSTGADEEAARIHEKARREKATRKGSGVAGKRPRSA